jgi:4-carboxymuconolactone decarboxylase
MPRLPRVDRDDIPQELQYVWDRLAPGAPAVPNIFRTLGNNPKLLRAYARFGNALWADSGLDLPTRELAILRTAILHHSVYEWQQHVRIGRQAGLGDDRILALHHWRSSELFDERERAMLAYVDAVAATEHPAQEIHDELAKHWPRPVVVGINLLAGYYAMTAKFLGAMEVETEDAFVGWQIQGGS